MSKPEKAIDPFDLSKVAMASSLQWRAQESVSTIDATMRSNYDILRAKVAASLRPLIVVQFDFSGGTYNLLTQTGQITVQPVPKLFEQIKSICHCPLGVYTVLGAYLKEPQNRDWVAPLREFGLVVEKALDGLPNQEFPNDIRKWSETILLRSRDFITESVKAGAFTMDSFRQYSAAVFDSIHLNMKHAARVQVRAVVNLLCEWKALVGNDWRNLYAVVLTTWTIEEKNQHWLVLREMMDEEKLEERLYVVSLGSARENTVEVGVMNLAIIVQDKIAGHLVFGSSSPTAIRLNTDLATRNDLLSSAVEEIIDEVLREKGLK